MMRTPAAADLQRWSDDVARDAASLAFLPLARAYRRQGNREAAIRLCLRGLEAHPEHVEAHGLLALLYLEWGDRSRAADEWSMVLRLEPGNFEALRGLGFCYLEAGEVSRARQHLERAALARPGDPAVQEALRMVRLRLEDAARTAGFDVPGSPAEATTPADDDLMPWEEVVGRAEAASGSPAAPAPVPIPRAPPVFSDPVRLFDGILASGPVLGVVLLDQRGLVLAGRLAEGGSAELLGAILGGAIDEAARTVGHLGIGLLGGMLLETEHAIVHLASVTADTIVLVAAKRDAPMGWVFRVAAQANDGAAAFLGGGG